MSAIYAGENLVVITGLPGNGKTLLALQLVDEVAKESARQVFTCGVNGVNRDDWKQLDDGKQWHQCPPGSIVLIDEAQRVFEPAGPGQKMPEHLVEMNTIRHKGILLVLTTQHPHLLHMNVRKLTQRHFHVVRKWGMEKANVYHWAMVADVGTRNALIASCRQATLMVWPYPKQIYAWYKSAELHTVRRKIPLKYYMLLLVPFVVVGLLVGAFYAVKSMVAWSQAPAKPGTASGGLLPNGLPTVPQPSPVLAPKGASSPDWLDQQRPRIEGLAYTAPVYDQVTQPVRAPIPAACVATKRVGCRCYSQQGTRLDVPDAMCGQIVERGFFQAFDDRQPDHAQSAQQGRGVAVGAVPVEREAQVGQLEGVTIVPAPPRWRDGSNGISGGKG